MCAGNVGDGEGGVEGGRLVMPWVLGEQSGQIEENRRILNYLFPWRIEAKYYDSGDYMGPTDKYIFHQLRSKDHQ